MREEEETEEDTRHIETSSDTRVAKKKHDSDNENEPPPKPKTKKLKIIKTDAEVKVPVKDGKEEKAKKVEGMSHN